MPLSIRRLRSVKLSAQDRKISMPKISLPLQLDGTSNLHLGEALDLPAARQALASRPSDESMTTPSPGSEPALTDASSVESTPTVEYNHLSQYFPGPAANAPALPQRQASHSKKEHERLARKRSLRGSNASRPGSAQGSNAPSARTSADLPVQDHIDVVPRAQPVVTETPPSPVAASPRAEQRPFSPDLDQLHETAEDRSRQLSVVLEDNEDDAEYMRRHGLKRFDASTYRKLLGASTSALAAGWI